MFARHALLPVLLLALLIPARADPAMPGMMGMPARMAGSPAAPCGSGTVIGIDASIGRLVIRHDELERLGMPAMTTAFRVHDRSLLKDVKVGDRVGFVVVPSDDGLVVTALTSSGTRTLY